jgi:DNA uptake protein ComE-like DNA-binding protein
MPIEKPDPRQAELLLEKLNKVKDEEELLRLTEIPGALDLGPKTAKALLDYRNELGGFTDIDQIIEVKGIGQKRLSLLMQALLGLPLERSYPILKPGSVDVTTATRVLRFINTAPNAKFIAKAVEIPGIRDIGLKTAERIFEYRIEAGSISTLEELDSISGIGPNRFTDIVTALSDYPMPSELVTPEQLSAEDAESVLSRLNAAKSPEEIDELINIPGKPDIGPKLSETIYWTMVELGGFSELHQIDDIPGIGPARFTVIVNSLLRVEEKIPPEIRAVIKARLAFALKPFLNSVDRNMLLVGTDSVSMALEKLSQGLEPNYIEYLGSLLTAAIESEVVTYDTTVADLVFFPHIASHIKVSPPAEILDPASIPDVSPGTKWFRNRGTSLFSILGPGSIEILTPEGWSEPIFIDHPVAVEPTKEGMQARNVTLNDEGIFEPSNILFEPAPALRITCRGGIQGKLTYPPHNLDLSNELPAHVPPDWDFPGNEVWINPKPGFPPIYSNPPKPHGLLPGRVTIGGGACPPGSTGGGQEEEKDTVFIGSELFIVVNDPIPWPWGPGPWGPWPWGPYPPFWDNGLYYAGPRIFGEEIDEEITITVTGCECIRRGETEKYTAHPVPEGGTFKWTVDDDEIAEIQGPDDQKTVSVKGVDIGKTSLMVKYSKDGNEITYTIGLSVIYQRFTPKDQPRAEIIAIPLIQPSPAIRIRNINKNPKIDTVDLERHRAKLKFSIDGQIKDPLIEITAVTVLAALRRRTSRSMARAALT